MISQMLWNSLIMPIVILTNENTASSSEILAGALKDLGKQKLVEQKLMEKELFNKF